MLLKNSFNIIFIYFYLCLSYQLAQLITLYLNLHIFISVNIQSDENYFLYLFLVKIIKIFIIFDLVQGNMSRFIVLQLNYDANSFKIVGNNNVSFTRSSSVSSSTGDFRAKCRTISDLQANISKYRMKYVFVAVQSLCTLFFNKFRESAKKFFKMKHKFCFLLLIIVTFFI